MIEVLLGLKILETLVGVGAVGVWVIVLAVLTGRLTGPKGQDGVLLPPPKAPVVHDVWEVFEGDKRIGAVRKDSQAWKNAVETKKILRNPHTGEFFRG